MIPADNSSHRAQVDSDGNIILPGARQTDPAEEMFRSVRVPSYSMEMEEGLWHSPELEKSLVLPWTEMEEEETKEESVAEPAISFEEEWEEEQAESITDVIEDDDTDDIDPIAAMLADVSTPEEMERSDTEEASHLWNDVRGQLYAVTNDLLAESGRQYQSSLKGGVTTSRSAVKACTNGMLTLWSFLTQPVWVPGRHNTPKQYSRGTLFVLDTVRFGGTFASLFVVLFVSLNFQSFWAIAESYVDPLADITAGRKISAELNQGLTDKLKRMPSLSVAGSNEASPTAFLPDVGPPENRLIIPKLHLNVPVVIPPNSNLIKEDWKALEEDIQQELQHGVVHYPGTARPGQAGNFFVTGHSSYFPWAPGKYKSVFARLGELDVGDEYWVYYGGDKYRYVVTSKKEIRPSDVTVLDQPVSKRVATLMTCTPIGTTLRRLILTAQEIDPVTGAELEPGEHATEKAAPKIKMEMLPI